MQWIYLICFALINAGLLALFGVRPGDIMDAVFLSRRKAATLSDELNVLLGTPAKGFFNQDYETAYPDPVCRGRGIGAPDWQCIHGTDSWNWLFSAAGLVFAQYGGQL